MELCWRDKDQVYREGLQTAQVLAATPGRRRHAEGPWAKRGRGCEHRESVPQGAAERKSASKGDEVFDRWRSSGSALKSRRGCVLIVVAHGRHGAFHAEFFGAN